MLDHVVEQFLDPAPQHFGRIAGPLRHGERPLAVRQSLMDVTGMSRLEAGKLVAEVQRAVKLARFNLLAGGGLILLGALSLLLGTAGVRTVIFFGVGTAQLVAGAKVWRAYRTAAAQPVS